MRAWDFGKRVCLIDRGAVGGTGVHNGALSSKTLWELSRDYRRVLQRSRGYVASDVSIDYAQVCHAVSDAVAEKTQQLTHQLDVLSEPLPCQSGRVTFIRGSAEFIDPHRVFVEGPEVTIKADRWSECFVDLSRRSAMSMLPSASHATTTTVMPHIVALAGLVP